MFCRKVRQSRCSNIGHPINSYSIYAYIGIYFIFINITYQVLLYVLMIQQETFFFLLELAFYKGESGIKLQANNRIRQFQKLVSAMMKLTRAGVIEHGDRGKLLWAGQIAEVSRRGDLWAHILVTWKNRNIWKSVSESFQTKWKLSDLGDCVFKRKQAMQCVRGLCGSSREQ